MDWLIDLKKAIIKAEIPGYENPNKIDIVEKNTDFNKQQKGKGIKILIPKEMLQRLPIALAQVTAVNTSENLLNEIRQIIYSSYREKKLLKIYNNVTNSIKL